MTSYNGKPFYLTSSFLRNRKLRRFQCYRLFDCCRPLPTALPNIYTTLGQDYDERVLPSITNEVLKAVVAQFDAGELITQRENLSAKVKSDLVSRAEQFGVVLDDIAITHLTFGREFTQAVEQKQVAQQEAEKARFVSDISSQTSLN